MLIDFKIGKCYKLIEKPNHGWPFYGTEQDYRGYHNHLGAINRNDIFLVLQITDIENSTRKQTKIFFKEKLGLIFCPSEYINNSNFKEL